MHDPHPLHFPHYLLLFQSIVTSCISTLLVVSASISSLLAVLKESRAQEEHPGAPTGASHRGSWRVVQRHRTAFPATRLRVALRRHLLVVCCPRRVQTAHSERQVREEIVVTVDLSFISSSSLSPWSSSLSSVSIVSSSNRDGTKKIVVVEKSKSLLSSRQPMNDSSPASDPNHGWGDTKSQFIRYIVLWLLLSFDFG